LSAIYQYAQSQLSNVANLSVVTLSDIQNGDFTDTYITYDLLAQAIQSLGVLLTPSQQQALLQHLVNYNNPHRTTAEQVGLGNVANLPVLTQSDLAANNFGNKYITYNILQAAVEALGFNDLSNVANYPPTTLSDIQNGIFGQTYLTYNLLSQAVQSLNIVLPPLLRTEFLQHLTNYNNPHQTTATQVGLGKVVNLPVLTEANIQANDITLEAYVTYNLLGDALASLPNSGTLTTSQKKAFLAHLVDYNNPHKDTSASVGLGNVANLLPISNADITSVNNGQTAPDVYVTYDKLALANSSLGYKPLNITEVLISGNASSSTVVDITINLLPAAGVSLANSSLAIQYKETSSTNWQTATNVSYSGSTTVTQTITGLAAGITYDIQVTMSNSVNTSVSAVSNTLVITTLGSSSTSSTGTTAGVYSYDIISTGGGATSPFDATTVNAGSATITNNQAIVGTNGISVLMQPLIDPSGDGNFTKMNPTMTIIPGTVMVPLSGSTASKFLITQKQYNALSAGEEVSILVGGVISKYTIGTNISLSSTAGTSSGGTSIALGSGSTTSAIVLAGPLPTSITTGSTVVATVNGSPVDLVYGTDFTYAAVAATTATTTTGTTTTTYYGPVQTLTVTIPFVYGSDSGPPSGLIINGPTNGSFNMNTCIAGGSGASSPYMTYVTNNAVLDTTQTGTSTTNPITYPAVGNNSSLIAVGGTLVSVSNTAVVYDLQYCAVTVNTSSVTSTTGTTTPASYTLNLNNALAAVPTALSYGGSTTSSASYYLEVSTALASVPTAIFNGGNRSPVGAIYTAGTSSSTSTATAATSIPLGSGSTTSAIVLADPLPTSITTGSTVVATVNGSPVDLVYGTNFTYAATAAYTTPNDNAGSYTGNTTISATSSSAAASAAAAMVGTSYSNGTITNAEITTSDGNGSYNVMFDWYQPNTLTGSTTTPASYTLNLSKALAAVPTALSYGGSATTTSSTTSGSGIDIPNTLGNGIDTKITIGSTNSFSNIGASTTAWIFRIGFEGTRYSISTAGLTNPVVVVADYYAPMPIANNNNWVFISQSSQTVISNITMLPITSAGVGSAVTTNVPATQSTGQTAAGTELSQNNVLVNNNFALVYNIGYPFIGLYPITSSGLGSGNTDPGMTDLANETTVSGSEYALAINDTLLIVVNTSMNWVTMYILPTSAHLLIAQTPLSAVPLTGINLALCNNRWLLVGGTNSSGTYEYYLYSILSQHSLSSPQIITNPAYRVLKMTDDWLFVQPTGHTNVWMYPTTVLGAASASSSGTTTGSPTLGALTVNGGSFNSSNGAITYKYDPITGNGTAALTGFQNLLVNDIVVEFKGTLAN
jgi:hypothetical protein